MAPTAYFIGRPQGIVYLPIGVGKMVRSISVECMAKMWQTGLVSNCAELGFLFQGNTRFVLLWGSLAHRHLLCTCIANIMSPPPSWTLGRQYALVTETQHSCVCLDVSMGIFPLWPRQIGASGKQRFAPTWPHRESVQNLAFLRHQSASSVMLFSLFLYFLL